MWRAGLDKVQVEYNSDDDWETDGDFVVCIPFRFISFFFFCMASFLEFNLIIWCSFCLKYYHYLDFQFLIPTIWNINLEWCKWKAAALGIKDSGRIGSHWCHWRGVSFAIFENKQLKSLILVYASVCSNWGLNWKIKCKKLVMQTITTNRNFPCPNILSYDFVLHSRFYSILWKYVYYSFLTDYVNASNVCWIFF